MKKVKSIDAEELLQEANAAQHKEAYKLIERNAIFRVGVGARVASLDEPPFFVEVNIKLLPEASEVDLQEIGKTVKCLKELQSRGYTLTHQDGTCISCEKAEEIKKLAEESNAVVTIMRANFPGAQIESTQT